MEFRNHSKKRGEIRKSSRVGEPFNYQNTMSFLRKNAYNNGGTFDNTDLLFYAQAVGIMKSRPVSDATSWWFYAAIHGEYLTLNPFQGKYPNWKAIKSIPASANLNDLPSKEQTQLFWNQCQHQSWFFTPWHRGYLAALENILRDIIINDLNGPKDWALPYWNYLKEGQNDIPKAFMQPYLPDNKTPNPLYIPERYGPNGDGHVFVEVTGVHAINDTCQTLTTFTGGVNYGGPETEFSHDGDSSGKLESNPHNKVHVFTGGFDGIATADADESSIEGLMSDPSTAALDPIFYIHHCNIDRMWDAWNKTGNNPNPNAAQWLVGPSASGHSQFAMPMTNTGTPWYFSPKDVDTTVINFYGETPYGYTYDDLSLQSGKDKTMFTSVQQRLINLGKLDSEMAINTDSMATSDNSPELVGASEASSPLKLKTGTTETSVKLDKKTFKSVSDSLLTESTKALPDEVYLKLENVTGVNNSNFLAVYVNNIFVESVALFGIRLASLENSEHGGDGLSFEFNISSIIDELHLANSLDNLDNLHVQIETRNPILEEIQIGRISVYRLEQ